MRVIRAAFAQALRAVRDGVLRTLLEDIDRRLRVVEFCPANDSSYGAPHTWDRDGIICKDCGVNSERRYLGRLAPVERSEPTATTIVTGCARHTIANLCCADCERVVRERIAARAA